MRLDEYRKSGGEQPAWLVEHLIGLTHNALLVGSKGSAKSMLAWFIARAVASGKPLMGFPTTKMPVLIIDEETPENDFRTRVTGTFGSEDKSPLAIQFWQSPKEMFNWCRGSTGKTGGSYA